MGTIIQYLRQFYTKDFRLFYFIPVIALMGIIIYLNYRYQLQDNLIGDGNNLWRSFAGYWLLYFVPFAAAFLLQFFFIKNITWHKSYWFWIILFLGPAFFSFRVNFYFHQPLLKHFWSGDELVFWNNSINRIVKVFILLIPVFIVWYIKDKDNQLFYGATAIKDLKPYLIMLLMMAPFVAIACTRSDFLQTYPDSKFIQQLSLSSKKIHYIIYELCYGFDFVSIEFFFRGFLILSLYKICGPQCIVPVACFYCAIHCGKPLGEAISSFWGGIFLGIISYHTKSIWGGLIVHVGIAWIMEAGSWMSILF